MDSEIEARVRNDTHPKPWGSQLDEAHRSVPVGPTLDYNLPAPPLLLTTVAMASAAFVVVQSSIDLASTPGSSVSGASDTSKIGSFLTSKSAQYDRPLVFGLQDASDVRRVCDKIDAEIEGRKTKRLENQKLAYNRATTAARGNEEIVKRSNKVKDDRRARRAASCKHLEPIKKAKAKQRSERDARDWK